MCLCVHAVRNAEHARVVQRLPKTVSETINTGTRVLYYPTKRECTNARYSLCCLRFEIWKPSQPGATHCAKPNILHTHFTYWDFDVRAVVQPTCNKQGEVIILYTAVPYRISLSTDFCVIKTGRGPVENSYACNKNYKFPRDTSENMRFGLGL